MAFRVSTWLRAAVALALLLLLLAPPASAQGSDKDEGPWYDVPALPHKKPWLQWVVGTVFAAACLGIAFKNPHRSHLD